MASITFKNEMTDRFRRLVEMMFKSGQARSNSDIAALMEQPVQIISKLLNGGRIITLEQASALSKNAGVSTEWLLTGEGSAFKASLAEESNRNLVSRITDALFQGEIPKALADDISDELMDYKERETEYREQIDSLNGKIIRMLEVAKRYSD